MEEQITSLKQTFEELNKIGNNSLFNIYEEKIIPMDNRVMLIFMDSLGSIRSLGFDSSSYDDLLKIPKRQLMDDIKNEFNRYVKNFVFIYGSYDKKMMANFAKNFADAKIVIQQEKREEKVSTEELGTLVSMLYFREKGYVVQKPIRTYGKTADYSGVDDVIAWRSPVIDRLIDYKFINKGCHISELACIRWLGKVPVQNVDYKNSENEIILIEVESSIKHALSEGSGGGIYQLLRAKKENIAKKLFICFPIIEYDIDGIFMKIENMMRGGPLIGEILFGGEGIKIIDSDIFVDNNINYEIERYEKNLKRVLLNNFYFEEILEMIVESNIDMENKGSEEVLADFYNTIENIDIDYILDKLNKVVKG